MIQDPGPGQYDIKSTFNKKYDFKVLNRLVTSEKSNYPRKVVINDKEQWTINIEYFIWISINHLERKLNLSLLGSLVYSFLASFVNLGAPLELSLVNLGPLLVLSLVNLGPPLEAY